MATVALEQGAKMRIFVVLAISLSFGVPALAQNALWGTSGNNASSGQNPTAMPAGQGNGQGDTIGPGYGPSGPGTPGWNPAATNGNKRKKHTKSQTALKEADAERAKMSGASTMKSFDDNASAKASQAGQSAGSGNAQPAPSSQAPASAAPAQAAPAPVKRSGVQTY
jgi:hypothetical protein